MEGTRLHSEHLKTNAAQILDLIFHSERQRKVVIDRLQESKVLLDVIIPGQTNVRRGKRCAKRRSM